MMQIELQRGMLITTYRLWTQEATICFYLRLTIKESGETNLLVSAIATMSLTYHIPSFLLDQ